MAASVPGSLLSRLLSRGIHVPNEPATLPRPSASSRERTPPVRRVLVHDRPLSYANKVNIADLAKRAASAGAVQRTRPQLTSDASRAALRTACDALDDSDRLAPGMSAPRLAGEGRPAGERVNEVRADASGVQAPALTSISTGGSVLEKSSGMLVEKGASSKFQRGPGQGLSPEVLGCPLDSPESGSPEAHPSCHNLKISAPRIDSDTKKPRPRSRSLRGVGDSLHPAEVSFKGNRSESKNHLTTALQSGAARGASDGHVGMMSMLNVAVAPGSTLDQSAAHASLTQSSCRSRMTVQDALKAHGPPEHTCVDVAVTDLTVCGTARDTACSSGTDVVGRAFLGGSSAKENQVEQGHQSVANQATAHGASEGRSPSSDNQGVRKKRKQSSILQPSCSPRVARGLDSSWAQVPSSPTNGSTYVSSQISAHQSDLHVCLNYNAGAATTSSCFAEDDASRSIDELGYGSGHLVQGTQGVESVWEDAAPEQASGVSVPADGPSALQDEVLVGRSSGLRSEETTVVAGRSAGAPQPQAASCAAAASMEPEESIAALKQAHVRVEALRGTPTPQRRLSAESGSPQLRWNPGVEMCAICCSDVEEGTAVRLGCSHGWYCLECMRRHAEARMEVGAVFVACPECAVPLAEHVLRTVLPPAVCERLQQRGLEAAVSGDQGLFACPTPNCTMRVALEDGDLPRLKCPICNKVSCLRCGSQPYHRGLTCQQHAERKRARRHSVGMTQLRQWMQEVGAKQCPTCQAVVTKENLKYQDTQKSECHKMLCRNCRTRFCFKCLKVLTSSFTCGCTKDNHGFVDPRTGRVLTHLRAARGTSAKAKAKAAAKAKAPVKSPKAKAKAKARGRV